MADGEWIPGEVFVPNGQHLSEASAMPGLQRALLFGEGKGTSGPALFRAASDDPESTGIAAPLDDVDPQAIVAAVVALAVAVVSAVVLVKQAPKIKKWWVDTALPSLRSVYARFTGGDLANVFNHKVDAASISPVPAAEFAKEVAVVTEDAPRHMSKEEAQHRLLLVVMAASIISEQLRQLKGAVVSEEDMLNLRSAMSQLSTSEVVERLNEALSSELPLVDDGTRELFVSVFGGGKVIDGKYRPVNVEQIESRLRLPAEGEPESTSK